MKLYTDYEYVYVDIGTPKEPVLYDLEGITWLAEQRPDSELIQEAYRTLRDFWRYRSNSIVVAKSNSSA